MDRIPRCGTIITPARAVVDPVIVVGRTLALLFAVWCLITVGAVAQEAGTAPTCTGCGGSNSERTRPRDKKVTSERTARPRAERAVSNDGAWAGVSTGDCIMTWRWTITVSNGVMTGDATGSVSRGGAVRGVMMVHGYRYDFVGHMSGASGSGTWRTTGNCSGGWTVSRS